MSAAARRFDSWAEMQRSVESELQAFEKRWTSPAAVPFFRGHSSTAFQLAPSLLRPASGRWYTSFDEANLYYEFRSQAGVLLPSEVDSWDLLFLMQHHGVPTRLLDWSESFAAALFFALGPKPDDIDIWFLDPYVFNKTTIGKEEILDLGADLDQQYAAYFVDKTHSPEWQDAVAIYPRRRSSRLARQAGTFTLHATRAPLETLQHPGLIRFTLDAEAWNDAHRYLQLAGINEFALFPDLDGLAKLLRKRFMPVNSCQWP